ncbi:MAG: hypothetical protein V1696_00535 [Candidatus Jorgensenbacteria bacterium]
MKKVFSFDAETNGLWGRPFAIGALVYNGRGMEIARFVGRCPIEGMVNDWVEKNVLPQMTTIPVTYESYDALLADFAKFYMANKADADVIVHMGVPVEAGLLRDMHDQGLIGDFDGPYPLIDLAGNLQQAGGDPTSVDKYVQKHGLSVGEFEGGTHNPLYDSAVAVKVYWHLLGATNVGGGGLDVKRKIISADPQANSILVETTRTTRREEKVSFDEIKREKKRYKVQEMGGRGFNPSGDGYRKEGGTWEEEVEYEGDFVFYGINLPEGFVISNSAPQKGILWVGKVGETQYPWGCEKEVRREEVSRHII